MGGTVDLVMFSISPEIEANLDKRVNKLGREIWGWVRNSIMLCHPHTCRVLKWWMPMDSQICQDVV